MQNLADNISQIITTIYLSKIKLNGYIPKSTSAVSQYQKSAFFAYVLLDFIFSLKSVPGTEGGLFSSPKLYIPLIPIIHTSLFDFWVLASSMEADAPIEFKSKVPQRIKTSE